MASDFQDFDPERTYAAIVRAGEEWADLDAAASLLEETKKAVIAKLMTESAAASVSAKEMFALADPQYRKHVDGMIAARKLANRARVRYDSARVLAELRRSQESTRRAEMALR